MDDISHPSVGLFLFIRIDRFQIFDQRINGVAWNLELGWGAKFGPEGSSIKGSPSGNPK